MSYVLLEFACPTHGRFERLCSRADANDTATCGVVDVHGKHDATICMLEAPWVISAPKTATVWGAAAERGKVGEAPPGALDTRAIADGKISTGEYMAKRRDERRKQRLMKLPKHVRRAVEKQGG